MALIKDRFWICLIFLSTAACSVISQQVRDESEPPISYRTLLEEADRYTGKNVILGGYILETKNQLGETTIEVLQTPLEFRDEPKAKERSEGRFIVLHKGFLDPEVYSKDRKITVAGTVLGTTIQKVGDHPFPCLQIESREIYIWPQYDRDYRARYYDYWYYPYPYFDPWYYPYPYYWYHHPRYYRKR